MVIVAYVDGGFICSKVIVLDLKGQIKSENLSIHLFILARYVVVAERAGTSTPHNNPNNPSEIIYCAGT